MLVVIKQSLTQIYYAVIQCTCSLVNSLRPLTVLHTQSLQEGQLIEKYYVGCYGYCWLYIWWNILFIRQRSLSAWMTYYVVFLNILWWTVPPSALKMQAILITVLLTLLSYPLPAIPLGINLASLTKPCTLALSMWREIWLMFCSSHGFCLWSAKSEINVM